MNIKSSKSYTSLITGNQGKIEFLEQQLNLIEDLSWYIFQLKARFGIRWWFNQKNLYHQCRKMFPEINSKLIQNFCRYNYKVVKGKKLPKKPVSPSLIIDSQNFDFQKTENQFSSYWLRFNKKNFPLKGKILNKINNESEVKLAQIYKKDNKFYCKLSVVKEIKKPLTGNNSVGCDVNYKRIVFSDNSFYSLKRLAHRKIEKKKNNQKKRNLTNYTKDFLHKLTTQIADDLQSKATEVLVLEDLRNLKKSASKKSGNNKGKMINYIINSMPYGMFQDFLEYKCLDRGIKVEKINPAYTSKTCSRCLSKNTERPSQDKFICLDCGFQLNADLNGSRNIDGFYRSVNGLKVNPALGRT